MENKILDEIRDEAILGTLNKITEIHYDAYYELIDELEEEGLTKTERLFVDYIFAKYLNTIEDYMIETFDIKKVYSDECN